MKRFGIEPVMLVVAVAAVSWCVCGCSNGDEHHYENKVFIEGKTFANELRVDLEQQVTTMTRTVSVGMGQLENRDIKVGFAPQPSLLATYREAYYDAEAVLLPEGHYDLGAAEAVIRQGTVASEELTFTFTGLDRLDLKNHRYVLPVSISTRDNMAVVSSARTIYFVVKEASLINVVADINENFCWPAGGAPLAEELYEKIYLPSLPNTKAVKVPSMHDWKNAEPFKDLGNFTMEMLVMLNNYKSADRQESNIMTLMGIEDWFLLRVSDAGIPDNWLQIAVGVDNPDGETNLRNNESNSKMRLLTGRWYHIAATFDHGEVCVYIDGNEVGTLSYSAESVDFSTPRSDEQDNRPRCLWIGYSYDSKRYLDGKVSEVRFWNKTLSRDEINAPNHFYRVSPASEGLIGYWKFDDGAGSTTAKDYSPYGNDIEFAATPTWVNVELPAKE